jgi:very-short-patch-repair endonuclease
MAAQSSTRFPDRVISRIAARQHGVVSHEQLLAAGVTRHQIARRLQSGFLVELHRGVYLVGVVPSEHAHEMAALLACGPDAVLSHRSAAAYWNLLRYPATALVHVTVPPARSVARHRIQAHRAPVALRDVRVRGRIRVSSPPRTILELSADLDVMLLEFAVAEANFRRIASDAELRDQVERNAGKRGVRRLGRVLNLPGGPRRTRSPGERHLLHALRDHGIDGYEVNAKIHGYEVDFLWRDLAFVLELDGWDAHNGRVAYERDRLKIAVLEAHGLTVMPVSGRRVRDDLDGVLDLLTRALKHHRSKS